jgi:hypothetical protein
MSWDEGRAAREHGETLINQVLEAETTGPMTTTARGTRYLTEADLRHQMDFGLSKILDEARDQQGDL